MENANNTSQTLSGKAIKGIKWTTMSQFSRQGLRWITTIILARLLLPTDFGLLSMAMVVITFADLFKDFGTTKAVIQSKNPSEKFLSSIFWINLALGLFIMAFLFVLAPVIADFYVESKLTPILRILSLTFFISSLGVLHQTILERNLAFRKLAKLEIISNIFGSVIGIALAVLGYGVWSLVYQSLVAVIMTTIMLWIYCSWLPKLTFHWGEVKSVINYSLNYTGFRIINYFERNADYILIGKFLGAQELGYYTLAYRLMFYPLQAISHVIGRVMFPAYSKFQDDNLKFRHAFLQVAGAIAMISFPMMIGLIAVSKPLILTIFGAQWEPVIVLIMILAPVGLVQSISTTSGEIFSAKGRTDWLLRWGIVSGSICILAFFIGIHWGLIGVAVAYGIVELILTYPWFTISFRLINLSIRELAAVLWQPLLSSIIMLLMLLTIMVLIPVDISNSVALGIIVIAGILTYLFASWMVNRAQLCKMLGMFGINV